MKKAIKYLVAALAAALLCLAFVACGGDKGTIYNFKESKCTATGCYAAPEISGTLSNLEQMYNTTYAGSAIEVKEDKIIWKIGGNACAMTYTMDGDKYMLEGDYIEQLNQGLVSLGTESWAQADAAYYGQKTDDGFAIVLVEKVAVGTTEDASGGITTTVSGTLTFTFYFTAA